MVLMASARGTDRRPNLHRVRLTRNEVGRSSSEVALAADH